jgi:tRNA(Ile)-lysidine synthase
VLTAHTLDDQAETVLLGLARGSGGRSLAGMRRSFEVFRRPLLDVTRADTETACVTEGIEFWTDPHNSDEQFTRVRVRTTVLPMLEHELGPGVARTLARTADQLRADTSYLDAVSDAALAEAVTDGGLAIERLSRMDVAVRGRVLRLAAVAAGSPPGELFHEHVVAVDRLVMQWHGQKGVDLPGHVRALRAGDVLGFERGLNR